MIMFVGDHMTAEKLIGGLKTVSPDTPIMEAWHVLKDNNIRRLPVLEEEKLVGIVTEGDLQEAKASDASSLSIYELNELLDQLTVDQVMTGHPITVSREETLDRAALLMRRNKVGGLPVLDDGELVGIITESDIFDTIIEVLGFRVGGVRMTISVEDRPGALIKALTPVSEYGNLLSIASERSGENNRITIRIATENTEALKECMEEAGVEVIDVR